MVLLTSVVSAWVDSLLCCRLGSRCYHEWEKQHRRSPSVTWCTLNWFQMWCECEGGGVSVKEVVWVWRRCECEKGGVSVKEVVWNRWCECERGGDGVKEVVWVWKGWHECASVQSSQTTCLSSWLFGMYHNQNSEERSCGLLLTEAAAATQKESEAWS